VDFGAGLVKCVARGHIITGVSRVEGPSCSEETLKVIHQLVSNADASAISRVVVELRGGDVAVIYVSGSGDFYVAIHDGVVPREDAVLEVEAYLASSEIEAFKNRG